MERPERYTSPFQKLAFRYRHVIKTGMELGLTARLKLNPEKDFRATPRHELVVATICDTLGRWTGLDSPTQENLNIAALGHDVDKKAEYRPDEFSDEEKAALERFKASQNPDLMAATKEKFVEDNKDRIDNISLPQMLLYYADMIVAWDQITPFRDRIAESRTRRTNLPNEFFDTELKFGATIEQKIFEKLPQDIKEKIGEPSQIPNFLISFLGNK